MSMTIGIKARYKNNQSVQRGLHFTKNYDNFYDGNHFHHISGKIIANKIIQGYNQHNMKDGIVLDQHNIDLFIGNYTKMTEKLGVNY